MHDIQDYRAGGRSLPWPPSARRFADLVGDLVPSLPPGSSPTAGEVVDTHGTTVIAVKYNEGVLNLGDRRATANMAVMFDRAEKVITLDDYTLMAISGSFARGMEIARYLQHAFKYYRRTEMQEMSLEGKISEVSRAIAGNLPMALQGIGAFLPITSAYDPKTNEGRIFFYDGMGARFETAEFGAAGSGSERIRGAFDYIIRTRKPFRAMTLAEALRECLILLDIAADLDAATGGFTKVLPIARAITREGIVDIGIDVMRQAVAEVAEGGRRRAEGEA
ncbi:MAG: proteasome subunit alpha [Armatimonadetes bacterium]|nr:proteasome subunit alpha [Armatimonadota bacterium]